MGVKVRERKPGVFWIFIDHKGRRKAIKAGTEQSARKTAAKLEEGLLKKTFNLGGSSVTFGDYAERWMDGHVRNNLKFATVRSYSGQSERNILPVFRHRPLASITRAEIRDFCQRLLSEGLSPGAVKCTNVVLSSIFNQAIEEELIERNPAARPGRYIKATDYRGKVEFLTPEEGEVLLAATREKDPRMHPLFLTALRSGIRQGELIGLKWEDIDWHGKFIEIRRTNYNGEISTPKNGKIRRVDMPDGVIAALTDHRRSMAAEALREGRPLPEWVFPSDEGTPLQATNLRKRFERCLKAAQLRHIPFHALRHSYASALIALGESLAYIRDQLGHHSIQITVDRYGHLVPGSNRQAVNRLDNLGKSATPAQPAASLPAKSQAIQGLSPIRKLFNQ